MKNISIDIETYSSADLTKTGVYRYVESPDFEILLFGYSVDGGEVEVVDLAAGEKIPKEIVSALTDDHILKWAFNASFERVCLSRWLGYETGEYLDPSSWRCSMVWSAYMGLPLSLESVGAVLGLEQQKMREGDAMVIYVIVYNQRKAESDEPSGSDPRRLFLCPKKGGRRCRENQTIPVPTPDAQGSRTKDTAKSMRSL